MVLSSRSHERHHPRIPNTIGNMEMRRSRDNAREGGQGPKRTGRGFSKIVLTPTLGGAKAIEATGEHARLSDACFPWHRVWIHTHQGGATTRITDESGQPIRRINAVLKDRAGLARRAQQRDALRWARDSAEPISFSPREESVWGFVILGAMLAPAAGYLGFSSVQRFRATHSIPPSTPYDWLSLLPVCMPLILALAVLGMLWWLRPRRQTIASIDMLPTGLVALLVSGETLSVPFDDRAGPRLTRSSPARLRFRSADGRVFHPVIPRPLPIYLRAALHPQRVTRAQAQREACKRYRVLGIRLVLLGVLMAVLTVRLIAWMGHIGLLLPQDLARLRRAAPFVGGYAFAIGLLMLFVAWKHSDHARRTLSRLRRRSGSETMKKARRRRAGLG